jgi:hypothetical protein
MNSHEELEVENKQLKASLEMMTAFAMDYAKLYLETKSLVPNYGFYDTIQNHITDAVELLKKDLP